MNYIFKCLACCGTIAAIGGAMPNAHAGAMFSFSGTDKGGVGSATMDIVGSGTNQFIVTLDNTSPILTTDLSSDNAPGITGFGFNVDPSQNLASWSLSAILSDKTTVVVIGDGVLGGLDDWKMSSFLAGVSLDYLPTTAGGNIKGALYNPLATDGLAALPNYFTTAVLTLNFVAATNLDPKSTFVRMQNVGKGGAGSLKLSGDPVTPPPPGDDPPDDDPPPPVSTVPEPGTFAIFFGLMSCVLPGWRLRKRAS